MIKLIIVCLTVYKNYKKLLKISMEELYDVERILERRKVNGKLYYKIKWTGYPLSESTWEPIENLDTVKELVEIFNLSHPLTAGRSKEKNENKKRTRKKTKKNKKENGENDEVEHVIDIDKRRIISLDENIEEKIQKEEKNEENNNDDNNKEESNKKIFEIDETLDKVINIEKHDEKLIAIVERKRGAISTTEHIPTEELQYKNPLILIKFYESKIKFT